jgi:hypothetical protein
MNDKLHQIFDTCAIHLMRMDFARSKVEPFLPLQIFSRRCRYFFIVIMWSQRYRLFNSHITNVLPAKDI